MYEREVDPELLAEIDAIPESPIPAALGALAHDPGAIFQQDILSALRELKATNPAEFARIRKAVKDSKNVSMPEFERQTAGAKSGADEDSEIFPPVELHADPVEGAQLLNEIVATLQKYVIADVPTLRAAALWIIHSWLLDVLQVSPIANITAPEKRCGKTVLLTAMQWLSFRPIQASNISPAALFRAIEKWHPTLMIDEVDSFLRDNDDARGIINAGFTKDSAYVIRCVGDEHTPTKFNVWGAKALCGIGKIADTLADRSIPLRMRRKRPAESARRLRHSSPEDWGRLRQKIARFTHDNAGKIASRRPADVSGLNDRAQDCWEPLLQIAETAGGEWPGLARAAAVSLHGVEDEAPSVGVELLTDIKEAFAAKRCDRLFSNELLSALTEDEEAPWATWNRGKPLTARQLSARVAEFGAKPKQIRIGMETRKGYLAADFSDAFQRYATSTPTDLSETTKQPSNGGACSGFANETQAGHVSETNNPKPSNGGACFDVSDNSGVVPNGRAPTFNEADAEGF